jgi:hypothetical protein
VLDVPTDWTVVVARQGNAGTFSITAPADISIGEAIVLISDAAGNTVMRTLEMTRSDVPITLCTQCGYNGSAWVDCYVMTNAVGGAQWSGNGENYYSGARSDRNGRANTASISSQGNSAVQICKNLGTGWYLPAYEELYAMSSGGANSASNNRAGAGILTGGFHWSSTEAYNNGGRYNYDSNTVYNKAAVRINTNGSPGVYNKTNNDLNVRCVWRK